MHRVRRLSRRLASLPHCHRGGTLLLWTTHNHPGTYELKPITTFREGCYGLDLLEPRRFPAPQVYGMVDRLEALEEEYREIEDYG